MMIEIKDARKEQAADIVRLIMTAMTDDCCLHFWMQRRSLQWIREQSLSPDCVESLATHDTDVKPHVIEF